MATHEVKAGRPPREPHLGSRVQSIHMKVSPREKAAIVRAARIAALDVSSYCRSLVMREIRLTGGVS